MNIAQLTANAIIDALEPKAPELLSLDKVVANSEYLIMTELARLAALPPHLLRHLSDDFASEAAFWLQRIQDAREPAPEFPQTQPN